jgi:type I restriction enzyme S subunit
MSDTLKISLHEIIEEPISGTRPKGGVNFDGEIPSFGGENVTMEGGLTYYPVKKVSLDFFNQMNRGQLQELDVLINKDGANTGKSTIYRKSPYNRACINEHLFILRGKPSQLDQVYFHYLLQSSEIKQGIERKITGSAQPGLNSQFCRNFPLEIVPLPEQKKIASILTSVDEVIENTQQQIDKLQDLKKATMNELLTKGIGQTEFKDSELGRIPKSWEVRTIGDIVNPKRPVTYGIVQAGEHVPDGIPYIRVSDMKSNSLHPAKMMRTSPVIAEKFMRSRVLEGDIVYALRGDVGKVLVVPRILEGANLTQGTALISKSDSIETSFLYWCFDSSATRKQTYDMAKGSTFVEMTLGNLKNIKIPVPPCIEQSAIAKILDSIEGTISLKVEKFHQTQSLKKSLMQDLLTGKVRVTVN